MRVDECAFCWTLGCWQESICHSNQSRTGSSDSRHRGPPDFRRGHFQAGQSNQGKISRRAKCWCYFGHSRCRGVDSSRDVESKCIILGSSCDVSTYLESEFLLGLVVLLATILDSAAFESDSLPAQLQHILRLVVKFESPDESQRVQLWQKLIPKTGSVDKTITNKSYVDVTKMEHIRGTGHQTCNSRCCSSCCDASRVRKADSIG